MGLADEKFGGLLEIDEGVSDAAARFGAPAEVLWEDPDALRPITYASHGSRRHGDGVSAVEPPEPNWSSACRPMVLTDGLARRRWG
ncbi:hypothetical protein Acsp04_42390 [Actinomadura sp. NBRC 104425]|nr:hypothetical protein Acsp04_42390 [Actinomadura sp. NBRC 104425]